MEHILSHLSLTEKGRRSLYSKLLPIEVNKVNNWFKYAMLHVHNNKQQELRLHLPEIIGPHTDHSYVEN